MAAGGKVSFDEVVFTIIFTESPSGCSLLTGSQLPRTVTRIKECRPVVVAQQAVGRETCRSSNQIGMFELMALIFPLYSWIGNAFSR
jgi:hypothetical protein